MLVSIAAPGGMSLACLLYLVMDETASLQRTGQKVTAGPCRALPTEDGGVLVDLHHNIYYTLNHSGLAIWKSLEAVPRRRTLRGRSPASSMLTPDVAQDAVDQFVRTWNEKDSS